MEGYKGQLGSVTIWGVIVFALSFVANRYGYVITEDMQSELIGFLADAVTQAVALGGAVIAWWGRIRATKRIGK